MELVTRALGLLLVLAAALSAAPARAQDAADRRRARQLFEQADGALSGGRFAEARDLLRRSLALYPHTATAFNLAVALRGTGEIRAAVQTFDQLLSGSHGELDAEQRAQAETLREETAAEVGVVRITTSGAPRVEIRVDGVRVGEIDDGGSLEWRCDPGPRVVTASAERHETEERRLEVERGRTHEVAMELHLTAEAARGTIVLEATEADHRLAIVGVAEGRGLLRRQVDPGTYRVVVESEEGRRESEVTVDGGETLRVHLDVAGADDVAASPWLWTGVGLAVVGLVVGAIVLFVPVQQQPIEDDVWGVTYTLRFE